MADLRLQAGFVGLVAIVAAWPLVAAAANHGTPSGPLSLASPVRPSKGPSQIYLVQLNEAVALSFSAAPEAALVALDRLRDSGVLEGYQPFWAARADILRRAGNLRDAAHAYRRALDLTDNAAERSFLERRLADLQLDDVPL